MRLALALLGLLGLLGPLGSGACGGATSPVDALTPVDAATPVGDLSVDKAASCASSFGNLLTAPYGRLDGKIRAVVPPAHPSCALPNATHLVLQVDAQGASYRIVVNVESDRAGSDPTVRLAMIDAPLAGPAFAEGWHAPVALDYVDTLGTHDTAFSPHPRDELVRLVTDQLALGAPVAVYSSTSGGASSHLIHRNQPGQDGAIVVNPSTAPRWLLFAFSTQTF